MLCLWQASSPSREWLFGITVESITENWRALCPSSQLTADAWGGSLVSGFVVLVAILKSIKVQGMMLKIKREVKLSRIAEQQLGNATANCLVWLSV